jgi:hypothetical protein
MSMLSVVVPAYKYKEEENIAPFFERMEKCWKLLKRAQ